MSYNKILGTQCYEIKEGWIWGGGGGEGIRNELFFSKKCKLPGRNQHKMYLREQRPLLKGGKYYDSSFRLCLFGGSRDSEL